MEKCNICNRVEASVIINQYCFCNKCFQRIGGPSWKRAYETGWEAEKNRERIIELAYKKGYPDAAIKSINDYFMNQINTMVVCDTCKGVVRKQYSVGSAGLCENCFKKLSIGAWKKTIYIDNEEVEVERRKVLKVAEKNQFPKCVVDEINEHFDRYIDKDVCMLLKSRFGQVLKIYQKHAVLITTEKYSQNVIEEKLAASSQVKASNKNTDEDAAKMAFSILGVLGKGVGAGIGMGLSMASKGKKGIEKAIGLSNKTIVKNLDSAVSNMTMLESEKNSVSLGQKTETAIHMPSGLYKIDYDQYDFVEYQKRRKSGIGYIKFVGNGRHDIRYPSVVFYLDAEKEEYRKAHKIIIQGMERVREEKLKKESVVGRERFTVPVSVADEILKLKRLLDMGAITQEEYDKMKTKLLAN